MTTKKHQTRTSMTTPDPQSFAQAVLNDIEAATADASAAVKEWDTDRVRRAFDDIAERVEAWRRGPAASRVVRADEDEVNCCGAGEMICSATCTAPKWTALEEAAERESGGHDEEPTVVDAGDAERRPTSCHENTCEPRCRHRCPECRMGLGSHLTCDPQCEVADREGPGAPR